MTDLDYVLAELLPVIEADLRAALQPPEGAPPAFYCMMHYHLGWLEADGMPSLQPTSGKRVRPVLCLLCCRAAGADWTGARPAAAAIELIHNFSLLHDDIQDRSPLRRGRPTAWSIWGEAQAINAGDALFALAHLAIQHLPVGDSPDAVRLETLRVLDEACLYLTCGQHMDIDFETQGDVSVETYLEMVAGKTAALMATSAHLGALAAGAEPDVQMHYRAFGQNLGMAFQVMDDVLDIWGDPAVTGKRAAIDIHDRKKSLPVLYGLAHSAGLRGLYARQEPFDEGTVRRVNALLDEAGARPYAEGVAEAYSRQALKALDEAYPEPEAGALLRELADDLLRRRR
jgi:geranylgeranyl diphosphate synthase type I